MNMITNFSRFN